MALSAVLTAISWKRHHEYVDDEEATRLTLETLFDIKAKVTEIHDALFGGEDDEDEETEEDS